MPQMNMIEAIRDAMDVSDCGIAGKTRIASLF